MTVQAARGFSSDDPRVQSSVQQVFQLVRSAKSCSPSPIDHLFFLQYVIVSYVMHKAMATCPNSYTNRLVRLHGLKSTVHWLGSSWWGFFILDHGFGEALTSCRCLITSGMEQQPTAVLFDGATMLLLIRVFFICNIAFCVCMLFFFIIIVVFRASGNSCLHIVGSS